MAKPIAQTGAPKNLTATGAVTPGPCQLLGFYVNSTGGGTLVLDDNGTAISGAITPVKGYHRFPAQIGTSLNATIAAAALNVTFFFATAH